MGGVSIPFIVSNHLWVQKTPSKCRILFCTDPGEFLSDYSSYLIIIFSGRILMEAKIPPLVIPMWLTGFDKLMPEGRSFPYKYLPRIGARLSVTFGEPVSAEEIMEALNISRTRSSDDDHSSDAGAAAATGWLGGAAFDAQSTALIRRKVTGILHRDVEALGRTISGKCLNIDP